MTTIIKNNKRMEKIFICPHVYILERAKHYFNGEFDLKNVEAFLSEKCSGELVEYAELTQLHYVSEATNAPVTVQIKKAYKNQKHWFVVFELQRPWYKKYKGSVDNTFVYIQGDDKIISVTERGHGPAAEIEGELIYSCEE